MPIRSLWCNFVFRIHPIPALQFLYRYHIGTILHWCICHNFFVVPSLSTPTNCTAGVGWLSLSRIDFCSIVWWMWAPCRLAIANGDLYSKVFGNTAGIHMQWPAHLNPDDVPGWWTYETWISKTERSPCSIAAKEIPGSTYRSGIVPLSRAGIAGNWGFDRMAQDTGSIVCKCEFMYIRYSSSNSNHPWDTFYWFVICFYLSRWFPRAAPSTASKLSLGRPMIRQ